MPPLIGTFGSCSARGLGSRTAQAFTRAFTISPAISGKTIWSLDVDGPLNLGTGGTWVITPTSNFTANTKIWGAGGGGCYGVGAGGGAAVGVISFIISQPYDLIVGTGGAGYPGDRGASAGGAGSGIQITSGAVPILVAGGGGGSSNAPGTGRFGGPGGGTTGANPENVGAGGYPGTQSGPGAGGNGGRRTGNSGSGRNGGGGATGSVAAAGGVGFGNGGVGTYNGGDQGSGGGGGGYFGGGEGGGDAGGFGGGGGSGYFNPTYVTSAILYQGNQQLPGNSGDSAFINFTGYGGPGSGAPGYTGRIYLL